MTRTTFIHLCSTLALLLSGSCVSASAAGLTGVHHVGISTADIERSIRFYRDLLGMELLSQGEFENKALYDNIFALKNVKAKAAMLRIGTTHLELFEFQRPRGRAPDPRQPVNNPRIYHICFEVEDIQKEYERLKAAGVTFHYPPQDFGTARAAYARDPDGNVIELLQWMKPEGS